MWALFIALFGGVFWACKLCNEKAKSKEFDRRVALHEDRINQWKSAVLDDNLNAITLSMSESDDGFAELRNEATEVIRKLPGLTQADIGGRLSNSAKHAARYIYMVKRGKLPHGDDRDIPLSVWRCTDLEFSKKSMVAFAQWVENTMRANGHAEARLCYSRKSLGAVNPHDKSVVFVWAQTLFDTDDTVSLSEPNIEAAIAGESSELTESRNTPKIQAKLRKGCG